MTLLQDIIREATAQEGDVSRLLRLCLLLGQRLGHDELRQWARNELQGYPDRADLPAYRDLGWVQHKGYFMGPMGSWSGELEIPNSVLPENLREKFGRSEFRLPISEAASLVGSASKGSQLQNPWPVELAVKYGSTVSTNGQCLRAWSVVPASRVAAILDQIKTRVLDFALDIEQKYPEAGEVPGVFPAAQEKQVTQTFHTHITGNVQNLAAGNRDVTQTAGAQVVQGDWASLVAALQSAGVASQDVQALRAAVDEDGPQSKGVGAKVRGWLADLTLRAGQGVAGIGTEVVAGIVTQFVLRYYGLS